MTYIRGKAVFENVGGDILNPRSSGDAYDEMLIALHEVTEIHSPSHNRHGNFDNPFYMDDYYKHLDGIVEGATDQSYADMSELTWPGKDWQVNGGEFETFVVFGSNPHFKVGINVRKGEAAVTDYEKGTLRRVGERSLLMMNPDMLNSIIRNAEYGDAPNDERHLSTGYVVMPSKEIVDVKDMSGNVTGDSVRRALDPFSDKLASIASNLTVEAQRSTKK